MLDIFVEGDPSLFDFESRSVRLFGHVTSVRLEIKFWHVLEDIADARSMPMSRLLSELYESAQNKRGDVGNFASLLRCYCLSTLAHVAGTHGQITPDRQPVNP